MQTRDSGLDELVVGGLTLRGITRGGVETCLMVPELKLMFDVGMVPAGALKYRDILVSHGHPDHLGGIAYLLAQRGMNGMQAARIHVPEEIVEPLKIILGGWETIVGHPHSVELHGHAPGDRVDIGRGLVAIARRSVHRVPSLAWVIEQERKRLAPEYVGLSHVDLAQLRREGREISTRHKEIALCVSGDTQIELLRDDPWIGRARVLVYEVTGWDGRRDVAATRRWGHTHIDEMIEHAQRHFTGEALVLVHRSMRHSRAEVLRIVQERFPAGLRERVHVFGG